MTNVRQLLQTTLDNALYDDDVYSYYLKKTDTSGQDNNEYIVYLLNEDSNNAFSDDGPLVKSKSATVTYYYRDSFLDSPDGRLSVDERSEVILESLLSAGFFCPNGFFDAGDVDDIGFQTRVFECEYWEVI